MKDRIKKYMEFKSVSAGELSTLLEVQRSNISHILNGRNMPGAAFIEKLLVSFPDLNARWLLTGVGEMTSDVEVSDIKENLQSNENVSTPNKIHSNNIVDNRIEKPIDKVVLLFSDGTFIDYNKK
jgi:transcriptional regulator with XRE-family HTH domain